MLCCQKHDNLHALSNCQLFIQSSVLYDTIDTIRYDSVHI